MSNDFDWTDDNSLIVKTQMAIAVFVNSRGTISIAQEREWCDENDTLITFRAEHVDAIIAALLRAKQEIVG